MVSALPVSWLQHWEVELESELLLGPHRRHCHSRLIHHLDGSGEAVVVEEHWEQVVAEVPPDRHQRPAKCP